MNNQKKGCGCSWVIWIIIFIIASSAIVKNTDNSSESKTIDENAYDDFYDHYDDADSAAPLNNESYNLLNEKQKEIYLQLLSEVKKGNLWVSIPYTDPEDFRFAYKIFLNMHPEFFWLNNAYEYTLYKDKLDVTLFTYDYWTYTSDPNKYINALNDKIDKIVSQANTYPTTYEKVKFVHNYLVQNIEYDQNAVAELNNTFRSTATEQALSVYGALVNGKSICGGYSESFYLLMNALGIECYYITGFAGEYHAWNYLKIDGDYYYMDVTWDDLYITDKNGNSIYPDNIRYDYFCLTSTELARDHTADEDMNAPFANTYDYSYFVKEGLQFDTYNYSEAKDALLKQKNNSALFLKYTNKKAFDAAFKDLITNKKAGGTGAILTQHYYYIPNENIYTITIIPAQ